MATKVHQCASFENFVIVLPSLVICSSTFVHPLLFKDLASMHPQNIFSLLYSSRECFSQMKISRIYIYFQVWQLVSISRQEVKKSGKLPSILSKCIRFDICNKIFEILFSFFFFLFFALFEFNFWIEASRITVNSLNDFWRLQIEYNWFSSYNLYRCVCFVSPLKRPSSCSINFTRRVMRFPAVSGIHLSGICLVGLARLALNSRPCHGVTISVI